MKPDDLVTIGQSWLFEAADTTQIVLAVRAMNLCQTAANSLDQLASAHCSLQVQPQNWGFRCFLLLFPAKLYASHLDIVSLIPNLREAWVYFLCLAAFCRLPWSV